MLRHARHWHLRRCTGVTEAHMVDDPLAALGAFTDRIDLHLEPRDGVALKNTRQIILDLAVRGA